MANITDELREQLHILFPDYIDSHNGMEIRINCPLCEREGRKDYDHHMYFYIYDNQAPQFHCFRDSSHHGFINAETLSELSSLSHLLNYDLMESIKTHSRKVSGINRYSISKDGKYKIDNVSNQTNPDYNEIKRQYICQRLGIDLSFEELIKDKVIFSIIDLLKYNKIMKLTRSEYTINFLDKYFVGFLTNNNSTVIMRNLVYDKMDLPKVVEDRYIKYSIFENVPFSGYYIIPTLCDIYKHIDVHIAEGTFDILSVFYNLQNANRENNVYGSIGGNTYLNMIKYFLVTLGFIDASFYIYIDNDIKPNVIPGIRKALEPLQIPVYIVANGYPGEKDLGVSKDKIFVYQYRLC